MCYTGKCPYENHEGECTRPWGGVGSQPPVYPDDAYCVLMEAAQELEAAGLLGDIDIDDVDAINAAWKKYLEQQEAIDQEEALGELAGFDAVELVKAYCVRCPHVTTCGHVSPEDPDYTRNKLYEIASMM